MSYELTDLDLDAVCGGAPKAEPPASGQAAAAKTESPFWRTLYKIGDIMSENMCR
jgi:hypothetical protein